MGRRGTGDKPHNIRHRNGWRRAQVVADVMASEDVCYLCGRHVDKTMPPGMPGSPEVDEDIPVSRGGSMTDRSNCHLTHKRCNLIKHNHSTQWARELLGHPSAASGNAHRNTTQALRTLKAFD